uniref:Uncharacterized protein n=1 Tax=Arundo donax TaxID=35708 RepID=A0A0A8YAS1_ARUDO
MHAMKEQGALGLYATLLFGLTVEDLNLEMRMELFSFSNSCSRQHKQNLMQFSLLFMFVD